MIFSWSSIGQHLDEANGPGLVQTTTRDRTNHRIRAGCGCFWLLAWYYNMLRSKRTENWVFLSTAIFSKQYLIKVYWCQTLVTNQQKESFIIILFLVVKEYQQIRVQKREKWNKETHQIKNLYMCWMQQML